MSKESIVTSGEVAFSNLTAHEVFQGTDTGKYSVVITMSETEASKLEDLGVKVKTYEDKKQRKFSSKFFIPVVDMDDAPFSGEIPYGSKVRLLWATADAHPQYGTPTYLNRVRVVELADGAGSETPDEF